uniref:Uncharacterized protein n=1 Tax=Anguilla anguilla TaxID=7936 RepID=A0A0E9PMJ9_ANGAN
MSRIAESELRSIFLPLQ